MTQRRSVTQVFIASALGAVIGGLVGSLGGVVWAIIGLAIGGGVGYLAYDIKAVGRAIKQTAIEVWPKLEPHLEWKTARRRVWNIVLCSLAATPFLSFPLTLHLLTGGSGRLVDEMVGGVIYGSMLAGISIGVWACWVVSSNGDSKTSAESYSMKTPGGMWHVAWRHGNVLAAALWVVVLTGLILYGLFRLLVYTIPQFIVFTIRVLQLIHSDGRLCCMLGTVLGAASGRFLDTPLPVTLAVDGLVGGLFGTWSYFILAPWLLSIPLPERAPKPATVDS